MQSSVKDAVLRWNPVSTGVLTGDSRVYSIGHSWMVRHYLAERNVRIIDCAVRFNSNALVDELLSLDIDVDSALRAMDIRRAFTPYQILQALDGVANDKSSEPAVYYLLAPFKQFFDGDVAPDEAAYLLGVLNRRLGELGSSGYPIIVIETASYEHPAFASAYSQLRGLAHPLWEILNNNGPSGSHSILRTHGMRKINGTNYRTLQHPNGIGGATHEEVPPSLATG